MLGGQCRFGKRKHWKPDCEHRSQIEEFGWFQLQLFSCHRGQLLNLSKNNCYIFPKIEQKNKLKARSFFLFNETSWFVIEFNFSKPSLQVFNNKMRGWTPHLVISIWSFHQSHYRQLLTCRDKLLTWHYLVNIWKSKLHTISHTSHIGYN